MGVSDWTDQTGEELRHLVGNAIMEQAFEKYEYRKVLPKRNTSDWKRENCNKERPVGLCAKRRKNKV